MDMRTVLLAAAGVVVFDAGHWAEAQDIKITDYDVPVSRSEELYITGNMNKLESAEIEPGTDLFEDYNLGGSWQSFYNSPYYAWKVSGWSTLAFTRDNGRKLQFREYAYAAGSIRRYASRQGLFFGAVGFSTRWAHNYDRPDGDLSASVGLGRTVEATVLARAIRIDEFLIKENIIGQHLTKETLLELAAIIDRASEFKMRYGNTYTVWWYAEMDSVVTDAVPLAGGSVGPIGLLRIREVLEQEQVQRRVHGWTLESGISTAVARSYTSDLGDPDVFVTGTIAYPLGLKQQCVAEARISTHAGETYGDHYLFDASLKYVYELSNRIDVIIGDSYRQQGSSNKHVSGFQLEQALHDNTAYISLVYYLENALAIEFGGTLEHRFQWINRPRYEEYNHRRWLINLSFGYHVF